MLGARLRRASRRRTRPRGCWSEGLIVNPIGGDTLRFLPPLVIGDAEVDEALEILGRGPSASIAAVDTRTRWTIGILVALVIGLVVGLIIVAGDNSKNNGTTQSLPTTTTSTVTQTQPTTTQSTATNSTTPNGGTSAPGSTGTTTPGGTGGL